MRIASRYELGGRFVNDEMLSTMDFDELDPEQMEKAKACKTLGEMLALAREEGYELIGGNLD